MGIVGLNVPLGFRAPSGGNYSPEAQAYFAAMSVQPSAARKTLINTLIVDLIADGVWAKLDWFVLLASDTAQAGLLNAVDPAKSLTNVNSVSFTVDRGYTGNGTSSYLTTGEVWNFSGANFSQNSATLGFYCNQVSSTTQGAVGTLVDDTIRILPRDAAAWRFSINSATLSTATHVGRSGNFCTVRQDGSNQLGYYAGALDVTDAAASVAVSANNGVICRVNNTFSADRYAAVYSGGALTGTDVANLHTRLHTYLTAIGAN